MHLLPKNKSTVQVSDTTKLNSITAVGLIKKVPAKRSLLAALLLTGYSCFAQQNLTLDSAIAIALRNSYDIEIARNNAEAADINDSYGMAGGLPVVTGTATDREQLNAVNQKISTGEHINRNSAVGNTATAGLQGSILLYNGMQVVSAKRRLEGLQKQSQEYLNASIINTIATVMTQYYDVVRQQSYLATLDTSIAAGLQRLNIVKTQLGVGLANNADLFQSQLDLNALIQSRKMQELAIEQAKTSLLTSLTLKPDSNIVITDTITVDQSLMLEDVMNNIYQSPDIAAASMQVTINQLIERETAAQRYPSLYANAGYNYNRSQTAAGNILLNQTYGPYIGLSLTVPIYNGSIYKRQQKIAAINTENARLQQHILVRDNTSNAVKNYQAYQKSLQQLQTQQESYALAKQLLDLVLMKFQARVATIVDVKNAQESFANAGYLLVNMSYAAKAAEIEMKRLTYQLR